MVQMKSMKWRNAYLLFYERKLQQDPTSDEEEEKQKAAEDIQMEVANTDQIEIE
jgi:hypothetical protein